MTLPDSVVISAFTGLCAVVAYMWQRLSAEHEKLAARCDSCEADRARLFQQIAELKGDSELLERCPAQPCPLRLPPAAGSRALVPVAPMLLLLGLLASCTVHPLVTRNGDAWLGGSLMTRATHEQARIAKADGTTLEYSRDNGDETAVPHDFYRYHMIGQAIGASQSVLNTATKSAAGATTTAGQASPAVVGGVVGAGIGAMSSGSSSDKPKPANP